MTPGSRRLRRAFLPVSIFFAVAVIHFVWLGLFPENDPVQDRWAAVVSARDSSWLTRYIETQSYWLGYCYSLAFAFAALALRRYHEQRHCTARNLAIGGFTLSGFLAVAGCYLLGCCGSPMMVVYLNLFGVSFLPFAKPLVATLTTLTILGAWWWMNNRKRSSGTTFNEANPCDCDGPRSKSNSVALRSKNQNGQNMTRISHQSPVI